MTTHRRATTGTEGWTNVGRLALIACASLVVVVGAACGGSSSHGTATKVPTDQAAQGSSSGDTPCVANGTITPDAGATITLTNVEATRTTGDGSVVFLTRYPNSTGYLSVRAPTGHPDQVEGSVAIPISDSWVAITLGHFADGLPPYEVSAQGADINSGGGGPNDPSGHPAIAIKIACTS